MAALGSSRLSECNDELIRSTYDRIRTTAQPEGPISPLHQKFFPTQSLKEILTLELVRQILNHHLVQPNGCRECKSHLKNRPAVEPGGKDAERIIRTDSSLNLFALLVFLRYPLLVGCFLSTYEDGRVPSPRFFTQYDLADRSFNHLPQRQMQNLIEEFEDSKWRFSAPDFDNEGTFQIHPERTIMPYLQEDLIDEGAYGKVYKVKVHPGYCSQKFLKSVASGLSGPSRVREVIFARKEYKSKEVIDFLKERSNLELIDKLKHPHLIHIKQTYQLGKRFNILFPYAKSNLQNYLRKGQAPRDRHPSKNLLWEQVLGITEALSKIINFEDPQDPTGHRDMKGYHLDLKPQNVLVFVERAPGRPSKNVLRISDFGQSEFLDGAVGPSGSTSRLIGAGGTDAYAPPEYYGIGASEKYDVWSLGIIVLEILAFAVRGIDGLKDRRAGLDNVRHTKGSEYFNSRFYSGRGRGAKIKPEILTWLKELLQDESVQDSERKLFVKPLAGLCLEMLEPDYTKRKSIDDALSKMREIFQADSSESSEETALSLKRNDEEILVDLKAVRLFPEGLSRHSEQSPFFILENTNASLRIFAGNYIRGARHQRQEMKVIPLFQHTAKADSNEFAFAFESAKDGSTNTLSNSVIVVEDEKHARSLQAALINHEVSKRYKMGGLSIKVDDPLKNKMKSANSNPQTEIQQDPVPLWIELWIEKRRVTSELGEFDPASIGMKSSLRRLNREAALDKAVPLGRVVIYCKDRTIIVPFTREGAISNRADDDNSCTVAFEPMDLKQSEVFKAFSLMSQKAGSGNLPGIPMCSELLCSAEENSKFLCKSLEAEFTRSQDAQAFYKLFRRQKPRWQALIKGDSTNIASFVTPC